MNGMSALQILECRRYPNFQPLTAHPRLLNAAVRREISYELAFLLTVVRGPHKLAPQSPPEKRGRSHLTYARVTGYPALSGCGSGQPFRMHHPPPPRRNNRPAKSKM